MREIIINESKNKLDTNAHIIKKHKLNRRRKQMKKIITIIALLFISTTILFAGGSSFGHIELSNEKVVYNGKQFKTLAIVNVSRRFFLEDSDNIKSITIRSDKSRGEILRIELKNWSIDIPVTKILYIIESGGKLLIQV